MTKCFTIPDFNNGNFVHWEGAGATAKWKEFFKNEFNKDVVSLFLKLEEVNIDQFYSFGNKLYLDMVNKIVYIITKFTGNTNGGIYSYGPGGSALTLEVYGKQLCNLLDFYDYSNLIFVGKKLYEKNTFCKAGFDTILNHSNYFILDGYEYLFEKFMPTWKNKEDKPKRSCSKGEERIEFFLTKMNYIFETEKSFVGCSSDITEAPLRYDFYLPNENLCIEYDGEQHYHPVEHFDGWDGFEKRVHYDRIKDEYCRENNIKLIRIPFYDYEKLNENYLTNMIKNAA